MRIESVLYTKPETCTGKKGTSGEIVKILCNYFEVISQPNWVLYQYHVDFAPVIDSKGEIDNLIFFFLFNIIYMNFVLNRNANRVVKKS